MDREILEKICNRLPNGSILKRERFRDQDTIYIEQSFLLDVMRILRDEFGFKYLTDLTALDHYPKFPRFEVVYHLWCHERSELLRIKVPVKSDPPEVDSVVSIWSTANWHERECFDMFGIKFKGHPDLRRILLWEGFDGHPLRKDYPVEGKE